MNILTLEEAYEQNQTKIKAIVQSRVSNFHDGEQIVQEVWKRICVGFTSYDQTRAFDSWAFRFCANGISDFYRKAYTDKEVSMSTILSNSDANDPYCEAAEDLLMYEQNPNKQIMVIDEIIIKEQQTKIHKAISKLPESIRYCIDSYYIYGNKVREIADELGLPIGTIKSRLRIGRERLVHLLADESIGE